MDSSSRVLSIHQKSADRKRAFKAVLSEGVVNAKFKLLEIAEAAILTRRDELAGSSNHHADCRAIKDAIEKLACVKRKPLKFDAKVVAISSSRSPQLSPGLTAPSKTAVFESFAKLLEDLIPTFKRTEEQQFYRGVVIAYRAAAQNASTKRKPLNNASLTSQGRCRVGKN
jgi:hypothetical protein